MLTEPDWSNDQEFPKRWVHLGSLVIMYVQINGKWHETEVKFSAASPSPSKPLPSAELERLKRG